MELNGIGHYDEFYDEIIFWAYIYDPPREVQDKAKIIDGENYSADCFGVCVSYDLEKKHFSIVTDVGYTDPNQPPINKCNLFYTANDGKQHWFKTDLPETLLNQIFAVCGKTIADKDKNCNRHSQRRNKKSPAQER